MAIQNTEPIALAPDAGTARSPKPPSEAVLKHLSGHDRYLLEQYLTADADFVDHPDLSEADAGEKLFGVKPKLVAPTATRFPAPKPVAGRKAGSGSRVPTLSADQERTLFLRINCTRRAIHRMRGRYAGKRLTAMGARTLIAWAAWEEETRERIVGLNMPLVLAMAKRTRLNGVDFNEMVSEGNMALLRSVDKFDCGRGFKFSTYCCRAILKAFSRVAMRAGRYRNTFPVEFDPSIERSDFLETKRTQLEADYVDDLKVILRKNMAELTSVEQTVIRQRFALEAAANEPPMPKTLEQVGQIIGVTKERVRQIQNKALKKIREAMEANYLAA